MPPRPIVESGAVVVLRLYDIANEIDLARAQTLAAGEQERAGGTSRATSPEPAIEAVGRAQLTRAEPKAMTFGTPPVQLGLGTVTLPFEGTARPAEAAAKLYDFGVLSLALRFPVTDLGWDEFVALNTALDRAAAAPAAATVWSALLEHMRGIVADALVRPSRSALEEDYLLTIVNRWERPRTAEEVLRECDVAALLASDSAALAASARDDLLRHRFSYYATDLVVLSWDHAFLVEPTGESDVADVLEVANAQLLELLYYDALLDAELPRMYDRVDEARHRLRSLMRRRYADLARELYTLVAEVTQVTEKVDNALKVVEDVYLARVYTAALELFRVPAWAAAVERKLEIVRDTYSALYDEGTASRAELLELTIVLLILFEIIMAFVR